MADAPIPEVVRVARNIRETERLYAYLADQAAAHAETHPGGNDLPGGEAMAQLGPVASLEAWGYQQDATERWARAYTSAPDEDPDEAWSAYQTLRYWSEEWRREHGADYDMRHTIATEAAYLRSLLPWAWDTLADPEWDAFAEDMRRAQVKLEDVLRDGDRAERGVPCMYPECRGVRVVRKLTTARDDHGRKTWRHTDWRCPKCRRTWDENQYRNSVRAAYEAAMSEHIDGEEWTTVERAAKVVGRPVGTVWSWVHRGHVALACIVRGRRRGFVRLADVWRRHEQSEAA